METNQSPLCEDCTMCLEYLIQLQRRPNDYRKVPHLDSPAELYRGAGQGCLVCFKVLEEWSDNGRVELRSARLKPNPISFTEFGIVFPYGGGGYREASEQFCVCSTGFVEDLPWLQEVWFEAFELKAGANMAVAKASTSMDSEESWAQIHRWMKECKHFHKQCNMSTPNELWLPTRLLDIGGSGFDNVRLVDTAQDRAKGPYVTLSHRWGSYSLMSLKSSTSNRLRHGISVTDLPATFKDAVYTAHRLGVQKLWIDSLCIYQDSSKDWELESSQMQDVYSHAMCNIAATGSLNAAGGFFKEQDGDPLNSTFIQFSDRTGVEKTWLLVPTDFGRLNRSPLNRRGWVLQERLLARRVIHFKDQIYWECYELDACEQFRNGLYQLAPLEKLKPFKGRVLPDNSVREEGYVDYHSEESYVNGWDQIIKLYSTCELSKDGDKLVALSGLAQYWSRRLDTRYLAGLFKALLPLTLAWHVEYNYRGRSRRPEKYRAPSWSWAAVDGGIEPAPHSGLVRGSDLVRVEEAMTTPLTSDGTGQIGDGWLTLQAVIVPCRIPERTWTSEALFGDCDFFCDGFPQDHSPLDEPAGGIIEPDVQVEFHSAGPGHLDAYLLPIFGQERKVICLIVAKALDRSTGYYRRLGLMTICRRKELDLFVKAALANQKVFDVYSARPLWAGKPGPNATFLGQTNRSWENPSLYLDGSLGTVVLI